MTAEQTAKRPPTERQLINDWIVKESGAPADVQHVMLVLLTFWNSKTKTAFPGAQRLADHCRRTKTDTKNQLAKAVAAGELTFTTDRTGNRYWTFTKVPGVYPGKKVSEKRLAGLKQNQPADTAAEADVDTAPRPSDGQGEAARGTGGGMPVGRAAGARRTGDPRPSDGHKPLIETLTNPLSGATETLAAADATARQALAPAAVEEAVDNPFEPTPLFAAPVPGKGSQDQQNQRTPDPLLALADDVATTKAINVAANKVTTAWYGRCVKGTDSIVKFDGVAGLVRAVLRQAVAVGTPLGDAATETLAVLLDIDASGYGYTEKSFTTARNRVRGRLGRDTRAADRQHDRAVAQRVADIAGDADLTPTFGRRPARPAPSTAPALAGPARLEITQ